MNKDTAIIVIGIVAIASVALLFLQKPTPSGVWINCGLSEISPDFTNEMREACRQARSQYESRPNK